VWDTKNIRVINLTVDRYPQVAVVPFDNFRAIRFPFHKPGNIGKPENWVIGAGFVFWKQDSGRFAEPSMARPLSEIVFHIRGLGIWQYFQPGFYRQRARGGFSDILQLNAHTNVLPFDKLHAIFRQIHIDFYPCSIFDACLSLLLSALPAQFVQLADSDGGVKGGGNESKESGDGQHPLYAIVLLLFGMALAFRFFCKGYLCKYFIIDIATLTLCFFCCVYGFSQLL